MSSPARAEGFACGPRNNAKTRIQQPLWYRSTLISAPLPCRALRSSPSLHCHPPPTHLTIPIQAILSLLLQFLRSIRAQGNALTHQDNEIALGVLLYFLGAAEHGHADGSIAFVPAARYNAASRARSSMIHSSQPPPQLPQ